MIDERDLGKPVDDDAAEPHQPRNSKQELLVLSHPTEEVDREGRQSVKLMTTRSCGRRRPVPVKV